MPNLKKYDAILVAGEGESSFKVYNRHKAFLKINGKCIINYVLEALQKVELIRGIFVVGSKDKLIQTILEGGINLKSPKHIRILEQHSNLYENIWCTFLASLSMSESEVDSIDPAYADKAVLIVPCDAPLITAHEVEYFILKSEMDSYDHVLGLTPEESLEYFYPEGNRLGVKMGYLHLKESRCRINNLHLVKPFRIENREYIQEMYQCRYQRDIKNVLLFGLSLIGKGRRGGFWYFLGLQMGQFFSTLNMKFMAKMFRALTPKRILEQGISKIMRTRFMGLQVPFPGAALDIDNDKDYEAIKSRFDEWREYLIRLNREYPLPRSTKATTLEKTSNYHQKVFNR